MTIENTLKKYIDGENLIFVERKSLEDWAMECIPLQIAGDCLVVRNTEDFKYNGYKVILIYDISDIAVDETILFHEKVYSQIECHDEKTPDFTACKNLEDVFNKLKSEDIIVSVDAERDEDCIFLTGKVISACDGVLKMRCYDELARWSDDVMQLDIDDINTVTFFDRCSLVMKKYLEE